MTKERLLEWRTMFLNEYRTSAVRELQQGAKEKVEICDLALEALARPEAGTPMWLVMMHGEPQAAYPRKVQAEIYASGFSKTTEVLAGRFVNEQHPPQSGKR